MSPDHASRLNSSDGTSPSADHRTTDPLDLLGQDLKTQLTVIRGQAHLLQRRLSRLDGLGAADRRWLLERAAHIDAAVTTMVVRIDQMGREEH